MPVSSATGLPLRQTAIISASTTSCDVMLSCIDQPTMRLAYRSSALEFKVVRKIAGTVLPKGKAVKKLSLF